MNVLTVTQLNRYMKALVDSDERLHSIYLKGEISNFTNHYKSGHFYFSLKDENSLIRAVMFRSYSSKVRFEPENGMKVVIKGSVSVFERDGQYQLYVYEMQPDGVGPCIWLMNSSSPNCIARGFLNSSINGRFPGIHNPLE